MKTWPQQPHVSSSSLELRPSVIGIVKFEGFAAWIMHIMVVREWFVAGHSGYYIFVSHTLLTENCHRFYSLAWKWICETATYGLQEPRMTITVVASYWIFILSLPYAGILGAVIYLTGLSLPTSSLLQVRATSECSMYLFIVSLRRWSHCI